MEHPAQNAHALQRITSAMSATERTIQDVAIKRMVWTRTHKDFEASPEMIMQSAQEHRAAEQHMRDAIEKQIQLYIDMYEGKI